MPITKRSLRRAMKISGERKDFLVRRILIEAWRRITSKTPVDIGRAKGNWNISAGDPDLTVDLEKLETSPIGAPAPLPTLPPKGEDRYYISNSVPYIDRLENGGYNPGPLTTGSGYSLQAPQGMVKVTLQELTLVRLD